MSDYIYAVTVITTDKTVGNALAAAIDPDVGGGETFDKGALLRPIGSNNSEPSAWAVYVPLKVTGYAVVSEFYAGGYPQALLDKGITAEQIDAARSVVTLDVGDRHVVESNALSFITGQGYESIPR